MSDASIRLAGGGPVEILELELHDVLPTEGDLLAAGQHKRSRILRLTDRGDDVDGRPFAAYNSTRPYYFYPAGPGSLKRNDAELKRNKAAVKRFARKVGRTKAAVTRSGLGIRFPSYDAFKHTYLGRSNVDLRGPRAPHMLQALVVRAGSIEQAGEDRQVGLNDHPATATDFSVGIYGQEAIRANGLNSEDRPKGMPQRRFIGSSERDTFELSNLIVRRVARRMKDKISGR